MSSESNLSYLFSFNYRTQINIWFKVFYSLLHKVKIKCIILKFITKYKILQINKNIKYVML